MKPTTLGKAALCGLMLSAALLGAETMKPALKDLAPHGLLVGAAVNQEQSDGKDAADDAIVTRQFDTISPENILKWGRVHPQPDHYVFEPADRYVAFGQAHAMAVIGHALVWHQQTPGWIFRGKDGARADRETVLSRMRAHILAVVGRYRGRIHGWDVVNEALEDDGTLRKTPWLETVGEDYIAKAFEYAHEADPKAELYYNDYNLWKPAKLQGALRIVKQLQERGLRIDAVGEQAHWGLEEPPLAAIDDTLSGIAGAGVKAMLTELDVDVLPRDPEQWGADLAKQATIKAASNLYPNALPPQKQEELARRYADIFALVLKHREGVSRVTFWGVTDAGSWLNNFPIPGRVNYPLLWGRDGKAKPAFDAVVKVLGESSKEGRH
jgi:endo-1,4-beta-xylanase